MFRVPPIRVRSRECPDSDFARREDGSLTIFSLFLFVLILMIAGMAVDMAMHERQRVAIQNALDSGVLAAGSLSSGASSDAEVTAMVKDYVEKAGLDPSLVTVTPEITSANNRSVSASADFKIDTLFMGLMGIDELHGYVASSANESLEDVEISLVLDISGSMSRNGKIEALRPAAKGFVTEVINRLGADRVSISIVPYNHQVRLSDDVASRINWENSVVNIPGANASYPGALTSYVTRNPASRCARFHDDDFEATSLSAGNAVEASGVFAGMGGGAVPFGQYSSANAWCSGVYPALYLYDNNEVNLHNFIDTLEGRGWTAIDYGMNWGVGILDSDFAPVVSDMADNGLIPAEMRGHPANFTDAGVKKIVVLMTDGINTEHKDLGSAFKAGPSRIWHSETLAGGNEFNGYLVEMPDNPASQRWYVPNSPLSGADDTYLSETALPADAVQWDYHALYNRFRPEDVPAFFFGPDVTARDEHAQSVIDEGSYGIADDRTRDICAEARDSGIEVYTIAFQAPAASETLLQDCAGDAGRYFDVDGLDIASAFDAIVVQVTQLRLTQ